jgi:hypothetical protein
MSPQDRVLSAPASGGQLNHLGSDDKPKPNMRATGPATRFLGAIADAVVLRVLWWIHGLFVRPSELPWYVDRPQDAVPRLRNDSFAALPRRSSTGMTLERRLGSK